ncbi:MAG: hypothetical protein AAGF77_00855 [Bacteroidota bacterium]
MPIYTLHEKIKIWIYGLGLFTALTGGHLVGSYILLDPKPLLDWYAKIVLVLFFLNLITFLGCVLLQLTRIPKKHTVMKAALLLLLNIPVAFAYLLILLNYEF